MEARGDVRRFTRRRQGGRRRRSAPIGFFALLLAGAGGFEAPAADSVDVTGTVCRMSLRADDAPLTEVLAAIQARTGVDIRVRGALDRRVSIRLLDRSVDDILDRLGLSFARVCESAEDAGRVIGAPGAAKPAPPVYLNMRVAAGPIAVGGEFSLVWPDGLPPAAESSLEDSLRALLESHLDGERIEATRGPAALAASFAAAFQREYDAFRREFPDSSLVYEVDLSTDVRRADAQVLSLGVSYWEYTGGAHGNYDRREIVLDSRTGRRLTRADLFREGTDAALTELIKDALRREKGLAAGASLKEAGFWEDDVGPCDNFFVDTNGVGFVYNPYDIAAYAGGSFSPHIPYEALRPLLRPEQAARLIPARPE